MLNPAIPCSVLIVAEMRRMCRLDCTSASRPCCFVFIAHAVLHVMQILQTLQLPTIEIFAVFNCLHEPLMWTPYWVLMYVFPVGSALC